MTITTGTRLTNEEIDRIVDETTQELLEQLATLLSNKEGAPC